MTDLHCHMLPGMDDGAREETAAAEMVCKAYEQGVRRIALTSHFSADVPLEDYLTARADAFERLKYALRGHPPMEDLTFKLGAEVMYSPALAMIPAERLCLEGTDLLLLEFRSGELPYRVEDTLFSLQSKGIVPLLAHVERYSFAMDDPRWLYRWAAAGGYAQINAESLLRGGRSAALLDKLVQWDLVHVVSSDAHSCHRRPPNLAEGLRAVEKQLGREAAERLEENARLLFSGELPELCRLYEPKRIWGKWR